MTATQQFIEDAVKGGYEELVVSYEQPFMPYSVHYAEILLDPLAWQAVGKTRGWNTPYYQRGSDDFAFEMSSWLAKQHKFIDHLADGKSIEDALTAITN